MTTSKPLLPQHFLDALIQTQTPVAVFLKSGIKLQGCIQQADHTTFLLDTPVSQLIYKHAVSTIVPLAELSAHKDNIGSVTPA